MYEFQDTMKQWRRMCKAHQCSKCPLDNAVRCISYPYERTDVEIETLEELIMNWVEEHPEPVYPTWFEFAFCQLAHRKLMSDHDLVTWMDNTPIPAEIAQKLGLKPREE